MTEAVFRDVEKRFLSEDLPIEADPTSNQTISGVATLCSSVISNRPHLESQVVDWLSKGQGGSIQTVGLRRALVTMFADNTGADYLRNLFIKSLGQFGDKFYIKHAPSRCQEGMFHHYLLAYKLLTWPSKYTSRSPGCWSPPTNRSHDCERNRTFWYLPKRCLEPPGSIIYQGTLLGHDRRYCHLATN